MDEEEHTISEAILELARVLAGFQAVPPAGATYPLEVFVTIHLDDEAKESLDGISLALGELSNAYLTREW